MKELFVVALLLFPFLSNSQDSTNEKNRISVGINFSPNYSYRTLNYSDEWKNFVDTREESEHASFGFNTGIVAHYSILEKLEIELGVQYSRQTHSFKDISVVDIMGTSLGVGDHQLRYHYLEMPIRVNYLVVKNKFFGYVTSGISLNQFLNDKSKMWVTYNNGEKAVVNVQSGILNFNKTVVGIIGGIGLGYYVTEKLNVRLEPLYRYSLTPLADAPIDQHNYSLGGQVSLNLKL